MPITHGDVGLSEDGSVALYSCRTGYELVEASSARRPCHVYGGWAGPEPQWRRIRDSLGQLIYRVTRNHDNARI